jgi:hypothetical protein
VVPAPPPVAVVGSARTVGSAVSLGRGELNLGSLLLRLEQLDRNPVEHGWLWPRIMADVRRVREGLSPELLEAMADVRRVHADRPPPAVQE